MVFRNGAFALRDGRKNRAAAPRLGAPGQRPTDNAFRPSLFAAIHRRLRAGQHRTRGHRREHRRLRRQQAHFRPGAHREGGALLPLLQGARADAGRARALAQCPRRAPRPPADGDRAWRSFRRRARAGPHPRQRFHHRPASAQRPQHLSGQESRDPHRAAGRRQPGGRAGCIGECGRYWHFRRHIADDGPAHPSLPPRPACRPHAVGSSRSRRLAA